MEIFWLLVNGLVQLFGWLVVAFIAFILCWVIVDYLKISCVMFFVLLKNVLLKKDYLAVNGYRTIWKTFLECYSYNNFTGASGSTVHYEFPERPADIFRIKFDFTKFRPTWIVTKRSELPLVTKAAPKEFEIKGTTTVTSEDLDSDELDHLVDQLSLKEELIKNNLSWKPLEKILIANAIGNAGILVAAIVYAVVYTEILKSGFAIEYWALYCTLSLNIVFIGSTVFYERLYKQYKARWIQKLQASFSVGSGSVLDEKLAECKEKLLRARLTNIIIIVLSVTIHSGFLIAFSFN
jgi:hypothetical protein